MDDTELLVTTIPEEETTDLNISLPQAAPEILMTPNICVMGVGGGGGNAVNNMIEAKLNSSIRFIVANTDAQVMAKSLTHERIQLGATITQGLGAGSDPKIGEAAAQESQEKIKEALKGINLLFIAAGMGGGTGTGASPVIAKIAKEMGILTVAVVTRPFLWEGPKRKRIAEAGIEELTKYVDTILTISNQNLFLISNANTSMKEAFKVADDILYQAVKTITDLMVTTMDIQVDFADFRTITKDMGKAIMGSGEAEGENRALEATEKAIINPLLDDSIHGAKGVLISISGKNVGLWDAETASERIRQEVDEDATIIFGTYTDESLGDKIRVSVVATGLNSTKSINAPEMQRSIAPQQQTVVIPNQMPKQEPVIEQKAEETPIIFVPANGENGVVQQPETITSLTEEIESLREKSEDNFVPEEPAQIPFDEKDLKEAEQNETTDIFTKVIGDLNEDISVDKTNTVQDKKETSESEKKTFWDIFPGFWNEKKAGEDVKKRLQAETEEPLERKIPELPSETELEIPAFFNESKPL